MAIVEFEVFRDYLGVGSTDPEVDDVSRLYDAIVSQVKRLTRRDFEGDEGGSYNEVIRLDGLEEFVLPHVPVESITSIARVFFDGTEDTPYDTTDWRLESAARGLIRLIPGHGGFGRPRDWPDGWTDDWRRMRAVGVRGPDYVRVIWTTTGAIEAPVPLAILEWGRDRWLHRDQDAALSGYTTGQDAETYFAALAGRPPRAVVLALLGVRHAVGGGRV